MGRGLNLKMMAFLEASVLEVYGTIIQLDYILATQTRKAFYLPDTRFGKNW
jgi:hypothetical protein